jgi:hypothetical protein
VKSLIKKIKRRPSPLTLQSLPFPPEGTPVEAEVAEVGEVDPDGVVPQHEAEVLSLEVVRMVITQTAHGLTLFLPPMLLLWDQRMHHTLVLKSLLGLPLLTRMTRMV